MAKWMCLEQAGQLLEASSVYDSLDIVKTLTHTGLSTLIHKQLIAGSTREQPDPRLLPCSKRRSVWVAVQRQTYAHKGSKHHLLVLP